MFFVFKKIFILVSFTLLIVFKMVMFIMGIMFCNKKENAPARTLHTIKPCALCNSDCVVSFSSRNQSIRETGEEPKIVCFDCAFSTGILNDDTLIMLPDDICMAEVKRIENE